VATWYVSTQPKNFSIVAEDYSVIAERTILDYQVQEDVFGSVVNYAYLGEVLPEKLAEDEVVSLRTDASFTRHVGTKNEGEENEELMMEVVSYAQQTFIQRDNVWYYIEHDEAPKDVFKEKTKRSFLSWILGDVAQAVDIYAAAGDGHVNSQQSTWSAAQSATTGTIVYPTGVTTVVNSFFSNFKSITYTVGRMFLPFDTSSISSAATISSASLVVNATNLSDFDNDGLDYITVVQTSQATHTTLELDDFDNISATEGIDSGERKDLTGMATGTVTFVLNSTGMGWIKKAGESSNCSSSNGISCFGLREGHDMADSSISGGLGNSMTINTSEETGTSLDPYLSVAYTAPSSFALWLFNDF